MNEVGWIEMGQGTPPCEELSFIFKTGDPRNYGTAAVPDWSYSSFGTGQITARWTGPIPGGSMGGTFGWNRAALLKVIDTRPIGDAAWAYPGQFSGFQPTGSGGIRVGHVNVSHEAGLNKGIGLPVYGFSESFIIDRRPSQGYPILARLFTETDFPEIPPVSVGRFAGVVDQEYIILNNQGEGSQWYVNGVLTYNLSHSLSSYVSSSNVYAGLDVPGAASSAAVEAAFEGLAQWNTNCQRWTAADIPRLREEFYGAGRK